MPWFDQVTTYQLVVVAILPIIFFASLKVIQLGKQIVQPFYSPLRVLQGPKGSYLFGNSKDIRSVDYGVWHEQMIEKYGSVMVYKGIMGSNRLLTVDNKAMDYILNNTLKYEKGSTVRWIIEPSAGQGLLTVNGMTHKRQRRIINPAFNTGAIKEMTGVFFQIAQELRSILHSRLIDQPIASTGVRVDMLDYMSRTTLDTIGLTGFNHSFNTLAHRRSNSNENGLGIGGSKLSESFYTLVQLAQEMRYSVDRVLVLMLKSMFPTLRRINLDQRSKKMQRASENLQKISREIVEAEKRRVGLDQEERKKGKNQKHSADQADNKNRKNSGDLWTGKDLLSLIMKANANLRLGGDVDKRSLTDVETAHQIPTFLLSGQEPTAAALSWTMVSLALDKTAQIRLRNEILSLKVETGFGPDVHHSPMADLNSEAQYPTMDQLNSLPYLEKVVRESLRLHAITGFVERLVTQDDVIPVETPYKDRYGQTRDYIAVSKGDTVQIPIITVNHSKAIWGDDAKEFNPDRWDAPPKSSQSIPGVWGNQLTFGGGARACVAFKYAIIEMKAILFTLIKEFEFTLDVPFEEFDNSIRMVKKPVLKSDPFKEQLPMIIRRAPTEVVSLND